MVDFPLSFFICYQLSKDYTGYNLDILCFDDVGYNYHEWRINMLQASHQEHRTKMKSSTAIKPLDFYLLSASQKKWATRCFSQTCKMPGWALAPQLRRMRTLRTRIFWPSGASCWKGKVLEHQMNYDDFMFKPVAMICHCLWIQSLTGFDWVLVGFKKTATWEKTNCWCIRELKYVAIE